MDTKAVVARFEAERQALAMMDHPGIAKVLDGGKRQGGGGLDGVARAGKLGARASVTRGTPVGG
jgi:hypothetical protein